MGAAQGGRTRGRNLLSDDSDGLRLNGRVRRRGEWWRPEEPEAAVSGVLETDRQAPPRLELDRYLTNGHADNAYPIVLGTTLPGDPITLEALQHAGSSSRSSTRLPKPVETEVLSAERAYVGAHLPEPSDRTFRRASLELTDLLTWAGESGLDEMLARNIRDLTISVTLPEPKVVDLPFGKLTLAHGWSTTGDLRRSRGVEKSVSFEIELPEPLDVPAIMARLGNPLRYFLTFATDRPNEIERLTVRTYRYDPVRGTEVGVEYPRIGDRRALPDTVGADFLFDARGLGEDFASKVATWFELYDRIRPAMGALFGPRYRPGTFTDNHFLNVTQAAEAYHRAIMRNEVLPRAEHKRRLSSIYAVAPPEHLSWLQERLAYSNEPTFRDRLIELHARAFQIVAGVLGDAASFADPIVKARNALTHRGKPAKAREVDGREIYRLTEQTTFLLTACLLLDLGFDELATVEATRRSRRFRILTELLGRP